MSDQQTTVVLLASVVGAAAVVQRFITTSIHAVFGWRSSLIEVRVSLLLTIGGLLAFQNYPELVVNGNQRQHLEEAEHAKSGEADNGGFQQFPDALVRH